MRRSCTASRACDGVLRNLAVLSRPAPSLRLLRFYRNTALSAVLVAFGVPTFPQVQDFPERAQPSQPAGNGQITGRVVAADTGAAVRRAYVTLSGQELEKLRTSATSVTLSAGEATSVQLRIREQ